MKRYTMLSMIGSLALFGGALQAQGKPGLGLLPFTNSATGKSHDELAPLAKGLADMAIEELLPNPSLRIVERDQMNKIMEEQKLSADGTVDPSTVIKLGKIVAAKYMLTGAYITMGNSLVLTMKAFSVETSEIVWTGSVTGKTDNILVLINQLASKATKGLSLPPLSPVQEQAQQAKAERIKLPLQEALKFARALDAKDAGKKDEAVALFNQVLDKFPEYELAKKEKASISGK
jgi:TolB-like protein